MKTIKEISKQAGVSKAAIYALIKSHKIPTSKVNNVICVNEDGISSILAHYGIGCSINVESIDEHIEIDKVIAILEKQLDEKQKIIDELLKALENSQKLQAVPLIAEQKYSQQEETQKSKLSIFKRIFKKG